MSDFKSQVIDSNSVDTGGAQGETLQWSGNKVTVTASNGTSASVTLFGDKPGAVSVDRGNGNITYYDGSVSFSIPLAGGVSYNYDSVTGDYSYDFKANTPGSKFIGGGVDGSLKGNTSTGLGKLDFSGHLSAGIGIASAKITAGLSIGENGKLTGMASLVLDTPLGTIPLVEGDIPLGSLDPNTWLEHSGIFGNTSFGNAYQLLASRGMYLDGMINGTIPGGMSHQEWLNQLNAAADLKIDAKLQLDANAIEQSMVRRDPLVFDLDGDGIETVSSDAGIIFDHDGDGIKQGTGWVSADDGLLVLDINGNGTIDSGRELFGDNTELASGEKARDGFAALRDLDSNGDGIIDSNDLVYSQLKIWQDVNQDGISQASELKTLSELDITSINLDAEYTNRIQEDNLISFTSEYTDSTGNNYSFGTLDFAVNSFHREFDVITISEEAQDVVDFKGSGSVRDLREAATLNTDLLNIYNQFSVATTRVEQEALIDKLLAVWAGSEGNLGTYTYSSRVLANSLEHSAIQDFSLGTINRYRAFYIPDDIPEEYHEMLYSFAEVADGRYEFNLSYFNQASNYLLSNGFYDETNDNTMQGHSSERLVQMLYVVEMFSGRAITAGTNVGGGVGELIHPNAYEPIENAYENLRENILNSLMFSTRLVHISDSIEVVFSVDGFSYDMTAWEAELIKLITADPITGMEDVLSALDFYQPYINQSYWSQGAFMSHLINDVLPLVAPNTNIAELFPSEFIQNINESEEAITLDINTQVAIGSDSADTIRAATGTTKDLIILGKDGDDHLYGGKGNDLLEGGRGNDYLYGSLGNDSLYGNEGNDTLAGYSASNNTLDGGEGDDTLKLNSGSSNAVSYENNFRGGKGNDTIIGSYSEDTYHYDLGDGNDVITDYGYASNQSTSLYRQDKIVFGADITREMVLLTHNSAGDLIITITDPSNSANNGQIVVKYGYTSSTYAIEGIVFSSDSSGESDLDAVGVLEAAKAVFGTAEADVITGLAVAENVIYGNEGNDTLSGYSASNNTLDGGEGDDTLKLNSGSSNAVSYENNFRGGKGNDTIIGSYSEDTYHYDLGDGNDVITDYGYASNQSTSLYRQDKIVFGADITREMVLLTHNSAGDLIITITDPSNSANNGQIVVKYGYTSSTYAIEGIEFTSDGSGASNLNAADIMAAGVLMLGTTGDDAITGTSVGNRVLAGAGNDTVTGGTGTNELYGEAGNDTLAGYSASNNTLDGGEGDDTLKLNSGSSNAVSYENNFRGGKGNDTIIGSYSEDTYHYDLGDGNDVITDYGYASNQSTSLYRQDKIVLGADITREMVLLTHNSAGDLIITITDPSNSANNGQIVVKYGYTSSTYAIEGIEFTSDGSGASNLNAADIMAAGVLMLGTTGDDAITGTSVGNRVLAGAGNDTVTGGTGTNELYGEAGNDTLAGYSASNNTLDGGEGDDTLKLNSGSSNAVSYENNFRGGKGNDTIIGSYSEDTYHYDLGDGNDVITDYGYASNQSTSLYRQDKIVLGADITREMVLLTHNSAGDLIITITDPSNSANNGQIVVKYGYTSSTYAIEGIEFTSDGSGASNLNAADIMAAGVLMLGTTGDDAITGTSVGNRVLAGAGNDTVTGGTGTNELYGEAGNDTLAGYSASNNTLDGGEGDDTLKLNSGSSNAVSYENNFRGGKGNDTIIGSYSEDTYHYDLGDGNDVITDYGYASNQSTSLYRQDKIVLGADITREMVLLTHNSAGDLIITITDPSNSANNGQIVVKYGYTSSTYAIEGIEFTSDSSGESDLDAVGVLEAAKAVFGTAEADVITGLAVAENVIYGNEGNDTLAGYSASNNTLDGGEGDDTLKLNSGSSNAVSYENNFRGGKGNDTIIGSYSEDTYHYDLGDGNDVITDYGYASNQSTSLYRQDKIVFGADITREMVLLTHNSAGDLIITITDPSNSANNGQIVVKYGYTSSTYAIEGIVFSSDSSGESDLDAVGVLEAAKAVFGTAEADVITGLAVAENVIYGNEGNDTLSGYSASNNTLDGGEGDDTLKLNSGSSNAVSYENNFRGGKGNDTIIGSYSEDTYHYDLGDGNDVITDYGYASNQSTSLYRQDKIVLGADITREMVLLTHNSAGDLIITITDPSNSANNGQIVVKYGYTSSTYAIEGIEFTSDSSGESDLDAVGVLEAAKAVFGTAEADVITGLAVAENVIYGNEGNDTLAGYSASNNTLDGGEGDDTLKLNSGSSNAVSYENNFRGGKGNDTIIGSYSEDTYHYDLGDGNDVITDYGYASNQSTSLYRQDKIVLGADITREMVLLTHNSAGDLIITITDPSNSANNGQIVVKYGYTSSTYAIEGIVFSSDSSGESDLDAVGVLEAAKAVFGTAEADVITGLAVAENVIYGNEGNDTLSGYSASNNTLDGGEGDDTLKLNSGSSNAVSYENNFRGGKGNDTIIGSYSEDTYHYDLGDGNDVITDYGYASNQSTSLYRQDKIVFGADITREMVLLTHNSAGDLIITITDPSNSANNGQIVVKYGYTSSTYAIEGIVFSSDSSGESDYSAADIISAGALMLGTEDDDVIQGTSIGDTFYSANGNDTLNGGGGSDIYQFTIGSGQDIVNNHDSNPSSIDVAHFDDVSIEDLWLSQNENDLQINIVGTDTQVTISDWYSGANYQLDQIEVGDSVLLNAQLEQLVSAMASFDAPIGAGSVVTQDTQDALKPILVESWHTL